MTYINSRLIKTICIILATGALITGVLFFQNNSLVIIHQINQLGWLAPLFFLIIYCLATILFLPTMVLTLAGGAIFGPIVGTILNIVSATSGAACAFLISRHLVYDWFHQKKGKRLNKLISGVNQRGWVFVAFLRVVPIIPFNLVNYGLGITEIRFRLYLITTFIFLIPTEIIYTWFGYAGMDAVARPGQFYNNSSFLLSGLAIVLLCIIKFIKRKRNDPSEDELPQNQHHL